MDIRKIQIIELAKCSPGLEQGDVIQQCKAKGLRPLSLFEWDAIMQDDELRKKYWDYWPAYTCDSLSYKEGETKAILTQWGKKPRPIYLPLNDGWRKMDEKTGIPNGEPTNDKDPKARYLYRWQDKDWSGLLSRFVVFDYRRVVVAGRSPYGRLGVLAVKDVKAKPHKHRWETKCSECGELKNNKN